MSVDCTIIIITMALYQLYSHNVEIKYKSYFFSKASLFTFVTTFMNIVLPFIVVYNSRGFWLKSYSYYEQPVVHSTFNYLLVANTENPNQVIVCGDMIDLYNLGNNSIENCAEIQVLEYTYNAGKKTDMLHFKINLNVQPEVKINSILLIFEMDFQLQTICELHMQTLAIIDQEFASSPSQFHQYGDIEFHQISHLPCLENVMDINYNISLFNWSIEKQKNIVDFIFENYFKRTVLTHVKTLFSKIQTGFTGNLNIKVSLRVPEMHIKYQPSVMQELKWAWPQYLSFVIVFYWFFNRLKKFVFSRRLLMAWEIIPWKHN